ncbi:hypothetical protein BDY19DRAFT_904724 [Irpex rosettiformis]|uniref:Uncharacterized protein n=1 Tax=Irpex rosettiformis TaxID=378272 RepID=A0ACB8UAK4_9APHY|nr:hypothetical protein BDY19DRAFT_904724 [Irpex rosettiformis]
MAAPARVDPMNAISRHAKVKVALKFAEQQFVSGEHVAGKMELECKTDNNLAIGVIMVELFASEAVLLNTVNLELLSRDHSAAQTFLHSQRLFQGPGLPPSNAVKPVTAPGDTILPKDFYPGRRGITTFLFRVPIPATSPPSINFGNGVARIRYEVRATVGVIWKGEKQLVLGKSEINVIERYDPRSPLTRPNVVAISENGRIWMKGEIVGDGVFAGESACVALTVKNHSPKKNTGLTVTMTRQLILPKAPQDHPLQILDTLTTVPFRGLEYIIHPGVEGVAHLVFDVPDTARTVKAESRYGGDDEDRVSPNLFSVKCVVRIKMTMGFGSKDVELELPVAVYHPSVLDMTTDLAPMGSPVSEQLFNHIPDYYSPPLLTTHYQNMSPPPQEYPHVWSPSIPFIDNGRVFLPPASPISLQQAYPYTPHHPDYALPFISPYISPARPSSAEPVASLPAHSVFPGLPASSVHQPLPALAGDPPQTAQREEGKGNRASRISHHLRMTSRARSVSPQAHRYIVYNAAPSQDVFTSPSQPILIPQHTQPTSPLSHSPNTTLQLSTAQLSPRSASSVVSPRPMHSPKHTVTVDPFTAAAVNKSENVDVLERVAAETIKVNADMSSSVPDLMAVVDKTLPRPPVPSSKTKPGYSDERLKATSLFPSSSADEHEAAPPTPTIAAFSSAKASRAALGVGGLDALEAKLLAEVGTRKVQQDKRPDVRTIVPGPIAIPRPDAVPDPAIDSAISSLSLPGIGGDEGTLRLDGISDRGGSEKGTRGYSQEPKEETATLVNDEMAYAKERSRKKSASKPRAIEEVREKEQHRLRKAAQGRVAAWLDSIDNDAPPQVVTPPTESPVPSKRTLKSESEEIEPLVHLSSPPPQTSLQHPIDSAMDDNQATIRAPHIPENDQDDKPDPRSSGFIPLGTLRKMQLRALEGNNLALPSKTKGKALADIFPSHIRRNPEVHYDIRSARGGRGGIVTAVASIWASQVKGQVSSTPDKTSANLRPPNMTPLANPSLPRNRLNVPRIPSKAAIHPQSLSRSISPSKMRGSPTSTSTSTPTPVKSPSADLAVRRAKLTKSSSVPAVVSSSLATPMLSSTASLARPKPTTDHMRFKSKLPPTISEMPSAFDAKPIVSPKPQNELAFGKARLRELIQKYQS